MVKFENIDAADDGILDHYVVELENDVGTGSAAIQELKMDGEIIPPEKVRLKIGNQSCKPFKPGCVLASRYGDKISIEVEMEGGLEPGEHSLGAKVKLGWICRTVEFKGCI